jgi:hypothetical protein
MKQNMYSAWHKYLLFYYFKSWLLVPAWKGHRQAKYSYLQKLKNVGAYNSSKSLD